MPKYQTGAFTGKKAIPQPTDAAVKVVVVDVDFPTAALLVNDLIELTELPPGVSCVGFEIVFPDIDSNGVPTLATSIGIENAGFTDLGTVWEAAITAGQSNAIYRNATSACTADSTLTTRRVALKVTAAAATYAGAGQTGRVILKLRG